MLVNRVATAERVEGVRLRSLPLDAAARVAPLIDLSATPDLFQPLALTMTAMGRQATFSGLDNLIGKETDRITAVKDTLERLGVAAAWDGRMFTIPSVPHMLMPTSDRVFPTYGDHRMAMALAPLALVFGSITLDDPDVVSKSYPGFWEDLQEAGFEVERSDAGAPRTSA